jgi:hypothetical protein
MKISYTPNTTGDAVSLALSEVPHGINIMTEDNKNLTIVYRAGDGRNVVSSGFTNENQRVITLVRPAVPVDGNTNPRPGDSIDLKKYEESEVDMGDKIHLMFDNKVSLKAFIDRLQHAYENWEE